MSGSANLEYKDIPLVGRLITSEDPSVIGENFQTLKNLRYKDIGLKGVKGMTKINTVAVANPKITAGIHFKKFQPAESHLLIQAFDSNGANPKIYDNTTAIPGMGNFTLLYTEDTAAEAGVFSHAPGEQIVFCDGKESLIWGGNEMRVAGFINYDETGATFLKDFTAQVTNILTTTGEVAILASSATECAYYIGSIRPLKGYKAYIGTANTATATQVGYYWSGTAWTTVGAVTDGTLSAGKTLAVTGSVTFTDTKSIAKPRILNGVMLYWYKFVTSAPLTGSPTITYLTVDASIQTIKNLWDGALRPCLAGFGYNRVVGQLDYYDYTTNLAEADFVLAVPESGVNLYSAFPTNARLIFGFSEPQMGFYIKMADQYNSTTVATATANYHNGTAFTAVSGQVDETSVGGKTLAKSGFITWSQIAKGTEFQTTVGGEKKLYYYSLQFSAAMASGYNVIIDQVLGVASPYDPLPHKFPVFAQERLWLLDEVGDKRNTARCSSRHTTEVWDGEDTETFEFGDGSPLISGHGLLFFTSEGAKNMVTFQKWNDTYALIGNTPTDWIQYPVSDNVGCVSKRTIQSLNITIPDSQTPNKQVLLWQSYYGIHMFAGDSPVLISHDISNYFDRSKSECITATKVWDSSAFVDTNNQEYHWMFYSGTAATPKELVYDFKRHKWFEIVRA